MQAILTKCFGPTATKGSRMKAICSAGSVVVDWEDDFGIEGNSQRVAEALCDKLQADFYKRHPEAKGNERRPMWNKANLIGGGLPNGDYCFVFTS